MSDGLSRAARRRQERDRKKGSHGSTSTAQSAGSIHDFLEAYGSTNPDTRLDPYSYNYYGSSPIANFLNSHGEIQCGKKTYQEMVNETVDAFKDEHPLFKVEESLAYLQPTGSGSVEVISPYMFSARAQPPSHGVGSGCDMTVLVQSLAQSLDGEAASSFTGQDMEMVRRYYDTASAKYPNMSEANEQAMRCFESAYSSQDPNDSQPFHLSLNGAPYFKRPEPLDPLTQSALHDRLTWLMNFKPPQPGEAESQRLRANEGLLSQEDEAEIRAMRNEVQARALDLGRGVTPAQTLRSVARSLQNPLDTSRRVRSAEIGWRMMPIDNIDEFANLSSEGAEEVSSALESLRDEFSQ